MFIVYTSASYLEGIEAIYYTLEIFVALLIIYQYIGQ